MNHEIALEAVFALLCHSGSCRVCWVRTDCPDRERLLYRAQRCVAKAVSAQQAWSYSLQLDGLKFDKNLQIATQDRRAAGGEVG